MELNGSSKQSEVDWVKYTIWMNWRIFSLAVQSARLVAGKLSIAAAVAVMNGIVDVNAK